MSIVYPPRKSFSFNCNEINLVQGDTFAYIEGAGITFWNVPSNDKEYIFSDRDGFCKLRTNHKYDLVVAAEYGLDPKIYVYSGSSKDVIRVLENPGQLDILDLQISRNGKRLLAVFGCPTFEVKCWNLETGEQFDLKQFTVNQKEYKSIHFNPDDHNSFIILNKLNIVYCEMKPCWDVNGEEEPIKRYFIESRKFNNSGDNATYENIGCIWDAKKRLYVTLDAQTAGKVMVYNMEKINTSNFPAAGHESAVNETKVKDYYYKKENPFAPKPVVEDTGPTLPGYEVILDALPTAMLLTQKHLIVAKDSFSLEWMLLEDEAEKRLTLEKEFPLDERCNNKIIHLIYNHSFEAIYIITEGGDMLKLPEKAETNLEEDEGDEVDADKAAEEGEKNQEKEFEAEIEDIAVSHSKSVSCIKEVPNTSYFISSGFDGKICLWEAESGKLKSQYVSESDISCADVSPDGKILLVGTTKSCIKIFDITNRNQIRLVGSKRLFKKDKPISDIKYSPDGALVAVISNSKRIFFLYGQTNKDFSKVLGKIKLQFEINCIVWTNNKRMPNEKAGIVALTAEGLMYAMNSPSISEGWENKDLTIENVALHIRRIDFGATKLCVLDTGDVLITGKDRGIKRYRIPDEPLRTADLKSKIPANPQEDVQGLELPCNVFFYSPELKKVVLGGQDGCISLRTPEKLEEISDKNTFKVHNYRDNGVVAIAISKNGNFIYTAGADGSIFLWALDDNEEYPTVENVDEIEDPEIQELEEIQEDEWDEDIPHYIKVIEEEEFRAQEEERGRIQRGLTEELDNIKNALRKLLEENEYADELERLRRDEFVIDLKGRDSILEKGEQEREKLKQQAYRENLRNKILFKRIKETTWDTMEVQLKGLIGLKSNHIVHNFQIRKITPEEKRKLKIALEIRKMEIKEKLYREERKAGESYKVESFCRKPDQYIVNGIPGYKPLVLVDYEIKEDIPQPKTNLDEDVKVKRQGKDNARGKYGAKKNDTRQKAQTVTKKVVEEEVKEDASKPLEDKEAKERLENPAWDNLYGAFDLITNNRKRTQIVILKDLIFRIKEKFNKEFEDLCAARATQCETINEKNNRIKEIQENLQALPDLFKPKHNIFEHPQRYLTVEASEIPFDRHLTREEKAQLEEERRKEEERIRLLQSDDAGVRAVGQMMNGTIEEKKETPLTETLVREEWMKKDPEIMTEDERMRLREFEAREAKLKEEKEKIKKSLESELKKLKSDINDICTKFDERLFILFRRRLEYEYRIFEQELYIIRLTLSMLMEQQNNAKAYNLQLLLKELYNKNEQLKLQREELDKTKLGIDEEKEKRENNYRDAIDSKKYNRLVLHYSAIFPETEDKKNKDNEAYLTLPKYSQILSKKLDPFYEHDKLDVKAMHQEVFENFLPEIEKKIREDDENDREKFKNLIFKKFEAKKALEVSKREQNDIQAYIYSIEKIQQTTEEEMKKKFIKSLIIRERLAKAISNIEIQIRFNQGQVELQHDDPIPRLADAILIRKAIIDNQNAKIQEKGNEKIEKKKEITETNYKVADLKYKIELCKLEIRDIEAKTNEVKRLKVKKEMQAALSKKDPRLSENELVKINSQMVKIKEATEKRSQIYLKKEEKVKREKDYLIRENKQLNEQGHALRDTVNQRKAIAQMMDEKNETNIAAQTEGSKKTQVGNLKIDPESERKFKEVSQNKRLFELAKRQTEEIELLREELNRLKAKTFANFTNQVNRF